MAVLGGLVLWCVLLLVIRIARSESFEFVSLCWNLVLAAVPLAASRSLLHADRRGVSTTGQVLCFALWLLFLPNAPYILTDLVHLVPQERIPLWYDLAVLLSFAGTGLMFGYLSLVDVHGLVERRFGHKTGWVIAVGSLMLSGFGIYLGRFLRWNSWEVVTRPEGLLADLADQLMNPGTPIRTLAVTLIFGLTLTLGYVALRIVPHGRHSHVDTNPR